MVTASRGENNHLTFSPGRREKVPNLQQIQTPFVLGPLPGDPVNVDGIERRRPFPGIVTVVFASSYSPLETALEDVEDGVIGCILGEDEVLSQQRRPGLRFSLYNKITEEWRRKKTCILRFKVVTSFCEWLSLKMMW